MQKQSPWFRRSARRPHAAQRYFHPRVHPLEDRRLLAADPLLFIEDFSVDGFPDQPGFDQADDDPATPSDRLLIQHNINARSMAIRPLSFVDPSSTYQPSAGFSLGMLGPASDEIRLPPEGTPGGMASGEEITSVAIAYSGLGII